MGFKLLELVFAIILYVFIRKRVFNNGDDAVATAHDDEQKDGTADVSNNVDVEEC